MPFVKGHLTHQPVSVTIESRCAHCRRPIRIEIDDALHTRVGDPDAAPVIAVPIVDFRKLKAPSIIDDF